MNIPRLAALAKSLGYSLARHAISALAWMLLLGAGGVAMIASGVFVLFGLGWALLAIGVFMVVAAALIRRGMNG